MSKLMEKLKVRSTGKKYLTDFKPVDVTFNEGIYSLSLGVDVAEHYIMELNLRVDFYASGPGELTQAEGAAFDMLNAALYDEFRPAIRDIRAAIYRGDRQKALEAVDVLERMMNV